MSGKDDTKPDPTGGGDTPAHRPAGGEVTHFPAADRATLAALTDLARSPVGLAGTLRRARDGLLDWEAA